MENVLVTFGNVCIGNVYLYVICMKIFVSDLERVANN